MQTDFFHSALRLNTQHRNFSFKVKEVKQNKSDWMMEGIETLPYQFNEDLLIHHLFEKQVNRFPNEIALICEKEQLTFRELDERSNHLADCLKTSGVGAEILVGICLGRSIDMVIGILGILKAGGAFVPLDPEYPKNRLAFMLKDAEPKILVTQQLILNDLPEVESRVVDISKGCLKPAKPGSQKPENMIKAENLAYVIYTSGSTGNPKGVMITHSNLLHYLTAMSDSLEIARTDRYLHTASISFSSSVRQLMLPLINGATVIIATNEQICNPLSLFKLIKEQRVTVLDFVPSFWKTCLNALVNNETGKLNKLLDNDVRLALSASEPFPVNLVSALKSRFKPQVKWINMFGQTETTGIVATYSIENTDHIPSAIVPAGRPLTNTEIYLFDKNLESVPLGTTGEIFIGGTGVGRGYLKNTELTTKQFIPIPNSSNLRSKLYKTGDLGRFDENGQLEFLGRGDNQIKIRGFRVELGEIESKLLEYPGINEAVVIARENQSGNKRLAAYFVARDVLNAGELRNYLKQKLPGYMVPPAFFQLDKLPLTPNGKIDRIGLTEPYDHLANSHKEWTAPRNDIESTLVKIWEKILEVSPIGINDNFFEIGGDSLTAISLFLEIEEAFHKSFPLSILINSPCIEKLAAEIESEVNSAEWKYLVPIQTGGSRPPLFCIHAAGGNVLFYRDLARELGTNQPVYGLQSRGIADKNETAHDCVEDMARDYLREIRRFQPKGPYQLCGSSFGGLAAFEAAKQLNKIGEEVSVLALFDTHAPGYLKIKSNNSTAKGQLANLFSKILTIKSQLTLIPNAQKKTDFIKQRVQKLSTRFKRKFLWKKNEFELQYSKATGKELPSDVQRNHKAIQKALQNYQPTLYQGEIILFRAAAQPKDLNCDHFLGWGKYVTKQIKTEDVQGTHGSLTVYPFAAELAQKLASYLT